MRAPCLSIRDLKASQDQWWTVVVERNKDQTARMFGSVVAGRRVKEIVIRRGCFQVMLECELKREASI